MRCRIGHSYQHRSRIGSARAHPVLSAVVPEPLVERFTRLGLGRGYGLIFWRGLFSTPCIVAVFGFKWRCWTAGMQCTWGVDAQRRRRDDAMRQVPCKHLYTTYGMLFMLNEDRIEGKGACRARIAAEQTAARTQDRLIWERVGFYGCISLCYFAHSSFINLTLVALLVLTDPVYPQLSSVYVFCRLFRCRFQLIFLQFCERRIQALL